MTDIAHTAPTVTDLLSTLVACPSVNPENRKHWKAPYGEAALATLIKDILLPWADEVSIEEVQPGRPNLIAIFRGHANGPTRAMEAHLDTVDVKGMNIEPFVPSIKDGRLYGRGATDTKGPMTAMLLALIRARASRKELNGEWHFIATCDEELGGQGAIHLAGSGFRYDGIIVAEPTELNLIDAHKGVERYRVYLKGRAAHSAYPEHGANAIHAMGAFIFHLELLCRKEAKEFTGDEVSGPLTVNVGIVHGGDQVNRIPDSAELDVDFRLPVDLPVNLVHEILERASEATCCRRTGIEIRWKRTQYYPPLQSRQNDIFANMLLEIAREHLEQKSFQRVRYATNAGFYHAAGMSCIIFGPGSISDAHTADESISLDEIERAADFLEKVIKD